MQKFFLMAFLAFSTVTTVLAQTQDAHIFGYSKDELRYLLWLSYAKSNVAKETGTLVGGKKMVECYVGAVLNNMSPLQFKVAAHEYAKKKRAQKQIAALKQEMRSSIDNEQLYLNHFNTLEDE